MPLILLVLISPGSSPRTNLYFYVINPLHKLWEAIVSLLGIVSYQHKPSRINSPCDCEYIQNAHIFCSKTIGHLKGTFSKKSLYHNITCHTRPSTSKGLTVLDEAACQDYEDGPLSSFWEFVHVFCESLSTSIVDIDFASSSILTIRVIHARELGW